MLSITEREVVDSGAAIVTAVGPLAAPGHLVRYDAACRAVAEAKTVDEVQEIAANAEALRAYARQARNRQLEIDAAEIRLRAERRLGELMAAQKDTVGTNIGGRPKTGLETNPVSDPATLAEAGIDKNLAHRARSLAAVADEKFEELLDDKRRSQDRRVVLGPNAPRAQATLKAENEALTQEVAALKQRVATLEAENAALRAELKYEIRRLEGIAMRWKERAMIAEDA